MSNKTWWTIFIVIVFALVTLEPHSHSMDESWNRDSLRGLSGVGVVVGVLVEQRKPDTLQEGPTEEQLQTDVELRLRLAGINVLTKEDLLKTLGGPILYVDVEIGKSKEPELYFFGIDVALYQLISLERNPAIKIHVATWSISHIGITSIRNLSPVRDSVKDSVDQFINAYLAVNPKK